MNNDTPITDAALCRYTGGDYVTFPQGIGSRVVPEETSRQLERLCGEMEAAVKLGIYCAKNCKCPRCTVLTKLAALRAERKVI